jgi:probable HAF family extracellular repeat protein
VPYSDQPPGSDAPTQANTGNFFLYDGPFANNTFNDGFAVTGSTNFVSGQNYLTDGGAYSLATSPYGTNDQGGNVYEWNEADTDDFHDISRGLRGSSWSDGAFYTQASQRRFSSSHTEADNLGFRVATVPEPSTYLLGALALVGLFAFRPNTTRLRFPRCAAALCVLFVALIAAPARAASYSFTLLGARYAYAVSADGSVVVGSGYFPSGEEAFRWTSGGGLVRLGKLSVVDSFSTACGVSADGSVVVGYGNSTSGREAFLWNAGDGMQSLRDVLIAGGVTGLDDWTLTDARGVSADGRTIVGYGSGGAWIATVPEPSSIALAAIALVVVVSAVASIDENVWRRFVDHSS